MAMPDVIEGLHENRLLVTIVNTAWEYLVSVMTIFSTSQQADRWVDVIVSERIP